MVCVPCIFIPVLLFIWHKFIQPYVLRFWNPWEKKDKDGNVIKTEFPIECKGGVCSFSTKNKSVTSAEDTKSSETTSTDDKTKSE